MQRQDSFPVKNLEKDTEILSENISLYIYKGTAPYSDPHDDQDDFLVKKGRPIPVLARRKSKKESLKETANAPAFWSKVAETAFQIGFLAAKHHHVPSSPGGNMSRQMTQGIQKGFDMEVVEPRQGKAFFLNTNLPVYTSENGYNFRGDQSGDAVAQVQAKHAYPSFAHVWVISTEPLDEVTEEQQIAGGSAVLFFQEKDAKHFIKNIKHYFALHKEALSAPPLLLPLDEEQSVLLSTAEELLRILGSLTKGFSFREEKENRYLKRLHQFFENITIEVASIINKIKENRIVTDSIMDANEHLLHLTDQLKNYLLFYATNRLPEKKEAPNEKLFLETLKKCAQLFQQENLQATLDSDSEEELENRQSQQQRRGAESPIAKEKRSISITSDAHFSPHSSRRHENQEHARTESPIGAAKKRNTRQ